MATSPLLDTAEISQLLDQCTMEELSNLLQEIETDDPLETKGSMEMDIDATPEPMTFGDAEVLNLEGGLSTQNLNPVPPSAPPPGNHGRRPVRGGVPRTECFPEKQQGPQQGENNEGEVLVTLSEVKSLLDAQQSSMLGEVKKLLQRAGEQPSGMPYAQETGSAELVNVDMTMLAQVLQERDQEVQELEDVLSGLQDKLVEKDQRVTDLHNELDTKVREIRHGRLDLEFQQLKLNERIRSNSELERAHRTLAARVEDANMDVRHAAADVELARSAPSTMHVQGSIPWTLRKNRTGQ